MTPHSMTALPMKPLDDAFLFPLVDARTTAIPSAQRRLRIYSITRGRLATALLACETRTGPWPRYYSTEKQA